MSNEENKEIEPIPWHEISREYRTKLTKLIESKKDKINAAAPYGDHMLLSKYIDEMVLQGFTLGSDYRREEDIRNDDTAYGEYID